MVQSSCIAPKILQMNLASQSVLEGLNACLDHRGEVRTVLGVSIEMGIRTLVLHTAHRCSFYSLCT